MPGIERVAVRHDVANPASGRVAEKAGFTKARTIETDVEAPGQTGVELVWERQRPAR
jgi:ribosomal-protein-serine acetyltransferase